jgi:hypothetical protein
MNAPIFPFAYALKVKSTTKGLSELVRLCFGKALNKSEQMSNWENRPLRKSQIQYAGELSIPLKPFHIWFKFQNIIIGYSIGCILLARNS